MCKKRLIDSISNILGHASEIWLIFSSWFANNMVCSRSGRTDKYQIYSIYRTDKAKKKKMKSIVIYSNILSGHVVSYAIHVIHMWCLGVLHV